jgi:hypothetical protein
MPPSKAYSCSCTEYCRGGKQVSKTTYFNHTPYRKPRITEFIPPGTSGTASTSKHRDSGDSEDEYEERHLRKRPRFDTAFNLDKPRVHEAEEPEGVRAGRRVSEGDLDNDQVQGGPEGQEYEPHYQVRARLRL